MDLVRHKNISQLDASRIEQLATEIQALVQCVYSPSLSSLEIALRACTPAEISLWVGHNRRDCALLVDVVLSSLERDQSAVRTVQYLSADILVRDLMLEEKPQLLDGLLRASVVNDRTFEKYSDAACALLRHDIPRDFLAPASLGNFVVLLIQMIQKDEQNHLHRLESILRGNARMIMQSISSNQQYVLTSALAGVLAAKDGHFVLLALSSLASISRLQAHDNSGQANQTASLFCKDKGLKVLRLIASTMSSHLSEDISPSCETSTLETICLVNVIRTAERNTILNWLSSKDGSLTIRKLLDKLELQMDNYRVQNAVKCLAELLCDVDTSIVSMASVATKIIENAIEYTNNDNLSCEIVASIQTMLPFAQPSLIAASSLVSCLLKYASTAFSRNMSWQDRIIFQYHYTILQALISNDRLHIFLAEALKQTECLSLLEALVAGRTSMESEEINFVRTLARLVLEVQLSSSSEFRLGRTLATRLLDRLTVVPKGASHGQKLKPTGQLVFALQQAANTPYSGLRSKNWRENLMVDLQTEAAHQHSRIVARVDAICGDLQHRTDTVEEPLREAEAQLEQARLLIERLRTESTETALELQQRDNEHHAFYEERQRFQHSIAEMLQEIEFSSHRIKILENSEAVLRGEVAQRELELEAQSAGADQLSQLMRDRCAALEAEMASMRDDLIAKSREIDAISRELSLQQDAMLVLRDEMEHYKHKVQESEDAIEDMRQSSDQQRSKLQWQLQEKDAALTNLEGTVDVLKRDLQTAAARLDEEEDKLARAYDNEEMLKASLEETKALADERLALQDEAFQSKSREMEDDLRHTRESHSVAMLGQEREIQTLRQTLARVRQSYEKRCEDFQKAQELSRRLMAVMGGSLLPSSQQQQQQQQQPQESDEAVSRHKRPSHYVPQDPDLTVDVTFDTRSDDKENQSRPSTTSAEKRRASRASMRKEDSAILSELSGLGIQ